MVIMDMCEHGWLGYGCKECSQLEAETRILKQLTKEEFIQIVEALLQEHTSDLEQYCYYGPAYGVSENIYDIVAEELWIKLQENDE